MANLFVRKSIADCENDIAERGGLKRSLNKWHLTALGVGATIGAGIFATTGTAIAGIRCAGGRTRDHSLSSFLPRRPVDSPRSVYAEFAAMVPVSGSAYTYAYASLGELVAWIIGWDLIVEYAVGNIGVAIGWAGYFRELLSHFGVALPAWLSTDIRSATWPLTRSRQAPRCDQRLHRLGPGLRPRIGGNSGHREPPGLSHRGIHHRDPGDWHQESANSNNAMVLLKIGIILSSRGWRPL
jgi:hypothetical protein